MDSQRRRIPPAPRGLGAAGKAEWRAILGDFELNPAELLLLRRLCETCDEIEVAKAALAESGPIVAGYKGQPRANPLIDKLVAYRKLCDQLVLALGLPIDGEKVGRRRSPQAKQAADARWKAQKRGRLSSVQHITGGA